MFNKLEKLKKTLIVLGTVFNIISGCTLLGILALLLFSVPEILVDVITLITILVFNLGLLCYLSALVIKVVFSRENKVDYENLAFNKLLTDYQNGELPEDVWRVVEYYHKVKTRGHLQFFTDLEIYKLNDTVETLIKILPLEFSNVLSKAYQIFNDLHLTENSSLYVEDEKTRLFIECDEFFKNNTQKYENYIKYYVGIINDSKN